MAGIATVSFAAHVHGVGIGYQSARIAVTCGAVAAGNRERRSRVVVRVTGVTYVWIVTVMKCRSIANAGCRNNMAPLADTGTLIIFIRSLTAGFCEENTAGSTGGFISYISANQVGIDFSAAVFVIIHVRTVAIVTLYVLALVIMVMSACVTVAADVHLVRLTGGNFGTATISAQHKAVSAAEISEISCAVQGGTA